MKSLNPASPLSHDHSLPLWGGTVNGITTFTNNMKLQRTSSSTKQSPGLQFSYYNDTASTFSIITLQGRPASTPGTYSILDFYGGDM